MAKSNKHHRVVPKAFTIQDENEIQMNSNVMELKVYEITRCNNIEIEILLKLNIAELILCCDFR